MNAVVQCILDSEPTEYEVSSPSYDVGQCRVIDLSSEPPMCARIELYHREYSIQFSPD